MRREENNAYEAAIDYLYSFINFEQKRLDRYKANKLDPTRTPRLMDALGSPHRQFPSIHIAGTKGKGSVAAMCAAALRAAGLRVGLYTSPHLIDFRERMRILTPEDASGLISKEEFVRLMERIRAVSAQVPGITWFEILTAIAFMHFADQAVDVAVVEVGLGGRLDATNVVTPLVSVITSLSLDHTYFLGDTLAEIAFEKGGIIKPGVPVVTAPQVAEAAERLAQIAVERDAPMIVVGRDYTYEAQAHGPFGQDVTITRHVEPEQTWRLQVALAGAHQQENAAVALAALQLARPHFPTLTDTAVSHGFAKVVWPGRLEILLAEPGLPLLLTDCAHNEDSAIKLQHALTHEYEYENLTLVYGVSADKDLVGMMDQLFPLARRVIVTQADHPRAMEPARLQQEAAAAGYEVEMMPDAETAVVAAWEQAAPNDLICVTGSIFVVGDLLNQWDRLKSTLMNRNR